MLAFASTTGAQQTPDQQNPPGTTLAPLVPDVPVDHNQEGPAQQSLITVTSRLVALDVVVVDKDGHFVPGLDKSKFVITEDKVPQNIRDFEAPANHSMPPGASTQMTVKSAADLGKIGNAPVNILVLDEVNTPIMHLAYARQMMEKYLNGLPEILPVPTLFIAVGDKRIAVLHDYTQSRAELLDSVKHHTTDTDFTNLVNSLNGGKIGADDGMVRTLGALSQIATSVRGVPGRKNVIWVGKGYGHSNDLTNLSDTDRPKVETAIKTVTDRMLAAHVTLYMIDPEGTSGHLLYGPSDSDADNNPDVAGGGQGQGLEFESFAYSTGGNVITGRNDIGKAIGEDVVEGAMYYTLSYRPSGMSNDKQEYRSIRVTMTDPSLRVITRKGYYAEPEKVEQVAPKSAKKQPEQIRFDLLSAARTTLAYTGLHMEAKPSKNGFTLLVKAQDLSWSPGADGNRMAEVTVLAVAYDSRGKEIGQRASELKELLGPNDVIGEQSKVGFAFPFPLPMKTVSVRIVMRDASTGTMGSVNATP